VAVILLVVEGVQLLMLGILAEYVWRGFEQIKGRPQFIIMDEIGFSHPET
jgi:polyisoprenyl-phosphate glycosyltransferase